MKLITTFKREANIDDYQAVVLASKTFSIMCDAYFDKKEIEEINLEIKRDNKEVYILVNKMIFEEELLELAQHLAWIETLDVNGIYFSDMAVYMAAKELNLVDRLIYAPGMVVVNSEDVKAYLALGIKAIEIANELTMEEKVLIANNNPSQVGVVISGYLLMSFSKRQALTNYFNEINKEVVINDNYNMYLIEDTRQGKMPVYEDSEGTYIYSEYVLDSFIYLSDLLKAGFKYLRIDGIFQDVAEIKDINSYYQRIIDGEDAYLIKQEYIAKYPETNLDDFFYHQKTSEVK